MSSIPATSNRSDQPLVARQLSATSSSTNTLLTASTRKVSILARGGNIRYMLGNTSQTATATSHYIIQGERLVITTPRTPNIAVIRADSTDCVLELTELS